MIDLSKLRFRRGKHYPSHLIPRSGPDFNTERMRRTVQKWTDRFGIPDDEKSEYDDDTRRFAGFQIKLFVVVQILMFLPYYFTHRGRIYTAVWKSHYYLPHFIGVLLLGVVGLRLPILENALLVYAVIFPIGIRGQMLFTMWVPRLFDGLLGTNYQAQMQREMQEQEIKHKRDTMDSSDVPRDKYLVPDDGLFDFDAQSPVAWLEKGESVIAFGRTQRGKSSEIKTLAAQLDYDTDTAVVAHGSRDDYSQFYRNLGVSDVLTLNLKGGNTRWNLFREVPEHAADWERELIFEDVSRILIAKSQKENPHFTDGARIILTSMLQILYDDHDDPDHADLYTLAFEGDYDEDDPEKYDSKAHEMKDMLKSYGFSDAAGRIQPGQKGDCWGTVTRNLRINLKGDFRKAGTFSFREYFSDPAGRVVSVESDEDVSAGSEMYAAMLDRANKQAMADDSDTRVSFVYDEITKIGKIENLVDLATRGLKQGSRMIVGVQTLQQLQDTYGEKQAASIVDNLNQVLAFQSSGDTAEYIQSRIGDVTEMTESVSRSAGTDIGISRTQSEVRRSPIESSTIAGLDAGECVVVGPGDQWWHIQAEHPDSSIPRMAQERGSVYQSPSAANRSPSAEGTAQTATAWDDQTGRR